MYQFCYDYSVSLIPSLRVMFCIAAFHYRFAQALDVKLAGAYLPFVVRGSVIADPFIGLEYYGLITTLSNVEVECLRTSRRQFRLVR